jgi:hypothetical protein
LIVGLGQYAQSELDHDTGPTTMDMLVKLYTLPNPTDLLQRLATKKIVIRRAMAHEKHLVLNWVETHFCNATPGWRSECDVAFSHSPIACQIAIKEDQVVGFACYDVAAKNLFGPIGIAENQRLKGVGTLLLVTTLYCMRDQGYAYGIIGHAGPANFFTKAVGAIAIPDSTPGIYPIIPIS